MNGKMPHWLSLARSIALIVVGILILVWEIAVEDSPNRFIIGVGLILLGVAPATGVLSKLTNGNGGKNGN